MRFFRFRCGDCAFLAATGIAAAATTGVIHQAGWSFWVNFFGAMAAAMGVQLLLALAAAPMLGSIESMVPSMVVAMLVPMILCLLEPMGYEPGWSATLWLGLGFGVATYIFVESYGYLCRRALRRSYPVQRNID